MLMTTQRGQAVLNRIESRENTFVGYLLKVNNIEDQMKMVPIGLVVLSYVSFRPHLSKEVVHILLAFSYEPIVQTADSSQRQNSNANLQFLHRRKDG